MAIKALVFGYCSECKGVSVVLDDMLILHKLGYGEAKQDCAFHAPEIKTAEIECRKCAKKTAIVRFPIVVDVEDFVNLMRMIEKNLDVLRDRAVQIMRDSDGSGHIFTDSFQRESPKINSEIREMHALLGAIKEYRIDTDVPQNYCYLGIYDTAE